MSRPSPLPILLNVALVLTLGACASPPPVGLYGSEPEAGDWVEAYRLAERARELARAPDSGAAAVENLLRRAIEADPAHGPAYLQLGTILEQQNDFDQALWAYAWAHKLMPGHPEAEHRVHVVLDRMAPDPSREPIRPIPPP